METLGLGVLLSEKYPGAQNMVNSVGSAMRRRTLSDITNITGKKPETDNQTKNVQNYISLLIEENSALMRLVDERNKLLEKAGLDLDNLKFCIQRLGQQNSLLSQANSQMLAEYNLGKDRLKAMDHELKCKTAALNAMKAELQEEKKKNMQYKKLEKINPALWNNNTSCSNNARENVVDMFHQASCKKNNNEKRKRPLRTRSLGPVAVTCPETAKAKDEGKRKSMRKACDNDTTTELCEPTNEKFFEIDVKNMRIEKPICSQEDKNAANADDDEGIEIRRKYSSTSPLHQSLGFRRSSIGRPMRRATEKVSSYKETPLNAKMRRNE